MSRKIATLIVLASACSSGDLTTPPDEETPASGAIEVITSSTGESIDADGYAFVINEGLQQAIGTTATLTLEEVPPGPHHLELTGIARNCTLTEDNPTTVTVMAGQTDTVAFTITCTLNHAPVPEPCCDFDFPTTTIDQPYGNQVEAFDADGDPLTFVVVDSPAHGTVAMEPDGDFIYTPNSGFFGYDAFYFVASDGLVESEPEEFAIVTNARPVARSDTFHVAAGNTLRVAAPGVLTNDFDPDGGAILALTQTLPSHGTIIQWKQSGEFVYVPDAGFTGVDSFEYYLEEDSFSGYPSAEAATVIIFVD